MLALASVRIRKELESRPVLVWRSAPHLKINVSYSGFIENHSRNKLMSKVTTLVLFYKQPMIKETSWMFLDFIQSLLIFVA